MFEDREKELKRLEQALLYEDEEDEEDEEYEEDEVTFEDEEPQPEEVPHRDPRGLIAIVFLVTAGVLLFLAFLLLRREGLL